MDYAIIHIVVNIPKAFFCDIRSVVTTYMSLALSSDYVPRSDARLNIVCAQTKDMSMDIM